MHLIVVSPFDGHQVGDRLTDPAEIARVLSGEQEAYVRRVADPVAPAPAVAEPVKE